jgi:hypothetical protein
MNRLQPEKEFIFRCMQSLISGEHLCLQTDSIFDQKLDWDWIVRTSYNHRLLGFLSFILAKQNLVKKLEPRIQARLKAGLLKSYWKHRRKQKQFQDVSRILNTKGIRVIPLKGVALSHLVYDDVPFRVMSDIDILVQQNDLPESFRLLGKAGFCDREAPSKNRWHQKIYAEAAPLYQNNIGRLPLTRKDLELDVHFDPSYRIQQKHIEMDVTGMWQRALHFPNLGSNVYMLHPRDQVVHLLLHTAEFHCPRLIQALDIARVMEKYSVHAADIADEMKLIPPFAQSTLGTFVNAIQELIDIESNEARFSQETTEVFERWFSRDSIPEESVDYPPKDFIGLEMLKKIRSRWKRLIFVAGYFLPNPDYYRRKQYRFSYLAHWSGLISKAWRLGRSKF